MKRKIACTALVLICVVMCAALCACDDKTSDGVFTESMNAEDVRAAVEGAESFTVGVLLMNVHESKRAFDFEESYGYSANAYVEYSAMNGEIVYTYRYSDGGSFYETVESGECDDTGVAVGELTVTAHGASDVQTDFAALKHSALVAPDGFAGYILSALRDEDGSLAIDVSALMNFGDGVEIAESYVTLNGDELRCVVSAVDADDRGEGYYWEYYIRTGEILPDRIRALAA